MYLLTYLCFRHCCGAPSLHSCGVHRGGGHGLQQMLGELHLRAGLSDLQHAALFHPGVPEVQHQLERIVPETEKEPEAGQR